MDSMSMLELEDMFAWTTNNMESEQKKSVRSVITEHYRVMAMKICANLEPSRQRAIALTNLQQAFLWTMYGLDRS